MSEQRSHTASHPAPAYAHASARHHPYAPPAHRHSQSGGNSHYSPQGHLQPPASRQSRISPPRGPPSPARSRGEDESPPLSSKFDHQDNYWDDVPSAPASLKTILDSFRRSGEGDRDLLLSILGAKKSEEDRLTALIQTRLTVLQARLNLSAMQAQTQFAMLHVGPRPRRTSSLTSQSSAGEAAQPQGYPAHALRERERERDNRDPRDRPSLRDHEREREALLDRERIHLRAPGYDRQAPECERDDRLPPITDEGRYPISPRRWGQSDAPVADQEQRERERPREPLEPRIPRASRDGRDRDERDTWERSRGERRAGLDMLLEGVREAERDSA